MVDDVIAENQSKERAEQDSTLADVLIPPARDPRIFERAVEEEKAVLRAGGPRRSERELCKAYGVPNTNRRWAKHVRKEAEARTSRTPEPVNS